MNLSGVKTEESLCPSIASFFTPDHLYFIDDCHIVFLIQVDSFNCAGNMSGALFYQFFLPRLQRTTYSHLKFNYFTVFSLSYTSHARSLNGAQYTAFMSYFWMNFSALNVFPELGGPWW
jgi:hypothetical protein